MLRFLLLTVLLALLIAGFVKVGSWYSWFAQPSFTFEIVIFFSLSNLALYGVITRKLHAQPHDFVKVYLGATVLRILFFGAFIFTVIILDHLDAHNNTLFFLVCYFLFTAMEVWALFLKIRSQKVAKGGQI